MLWTGEGGVAGRRCTLPSDGSPWNLYYRNAQRPSPPPPPHPTTSHLSAHRYLQDAEADAAPSGPGNGSPTSGGSSAAGEVKLLLQAFQLSLGAAMEHPTARMMREQMLARLMAVAAGGRLKVGAWEEMGMEEAGAGARSARKAAENMAAARDWGCGPGTYDMAGKAYTVRALVLLQHTTLNALNTRAHRSGTTSRPPSARLRACWQ